MTANNACPAIRVPATRLARACCLLLSVCLSFSAQAASPAPIGAEDDWYPYSAQKDGQPVGMVVDLVRAAFAASQQDIVLKSLPYARCMDETRGGVIAGCFDTLRNPLLETKYRWHQRPLFKARIVIYAHADHPDTAINIASLPGKKVAVTNGYDYGEAFDDNKNIIRDTATMDIQGLQKLALKRVDYAVIYDRNAEILIRNNDDLGGKLKLVGTLLEPDMYLSFSPDYPNIEKIIAAFDEGLQQLHANGQYDLIVREWQSGIRQ
jgi:polar amino acid transport system substrate-binding protein